MLNRYASLLALLILAGCSESQAPKKAKEAKPLMCHVGGTMRPLVAELAELYKKETGQIVEINSAGSGELLAHIEMQKRGDVYVCHDPFIDFLMKRNLGIDGWVIGELFPVIIVQKGNPKNIKGLKDLTRDDVKVFLTDYKLSSLGRMLPTIFKKAGINFEELNKKKKIGTNRSGGCVGNMVKMKNADAGIVWKVVAELRSDAVDIINIDKFIPVANVDMVTSATGKDYALTPMRVTVATLKCSKQLDAAAKFADFLVSDKVTEAFKSAGYKLDPKLVGKAYENGKLIRAVLNNK
jgi:molybdate transport system substrate-binding protein